MSKYLTIGMAGFLLGLKYRECCKMTCMKKLKKQAMKMMGL